MPATHSFRDWLVGKLADANWSTDMTETLAAAAQRLGVDPSVLVDAKLLRDQRSLKSSLRTGRPPTLRSIDGKSRQVIPDIPVRVHFPQVIYESWLAHCQVRQVPPFTMLRSLIHAHLLQEQPPTWIGRGWNWEGRILSCEGRATSEGSDWQTTTRIGAGAAQSLALRVRDLHTNRESVVRGILLDYLAGRVAEPPLITSSLQMFDVHRYKPVKVE